MALPEKRLTPPADHWLAYRALPTALYGHIGNLVKRGVRNASSLSPGRQWLFPALLPTGDSEGAASWICRNARPLTTLSCCRFGAAGVDRDDQKFVAVEGLHAWASAILTQAERLELAREQLSKGSTFRRAYLCEKHFLLIAAKKLIDYIDWARDLGFLDDAIFMSMLRLRDDILDLKITNEHVIEYYQGAGCQPEHWTFADELIVVDASPIAGKRIGNRLDGQELAEAASSLLIALPRHYFPGR